MAIKDSRWPYGWFITIRSIQLLFTVINLGLTAYIVSGISAWAWGDIGLAVSILTLIYLVINYVLFFMNILLPLAVVIVDAVLLVLWLAAMAGTGALGGVSVSCTYTYLNDYDLSTYYYTYSSYKDMYCEVSKGAFAMELLNTLLFIATLVFASITLHRYRFDLRGRKHAAGLPPTSGGMANPEAGVAMDGMQDQKIDYQAQPVYEQQQPVYEQQPVYAQQPIYQTQDAGGYQQPEQFMTSASTTPAPEQQQAAGYSAVSPGTNAHEMPSYTHT